MTKPVKNAWFSLQWLYALPFSEKKFLIFRHQMLPYAFET